MESIYSKIDTLVLLTLPSLRLNWLFKSKHSMKTSIPPAVQRLFHYYLTQVINNLYGIRNNVQLLIPIYKTIQFSTSHQLAHKENEADGFYDVNLDSPLGF